MKSSKWLAVLGAAAFLVLGVAACGSSSDDSTGSSSSGGGEDLSGSIRIDGSSTVAPLTEAVAEQFMAENSGVRVTVGTSGTGGGFEKFCAGETDISDASRAIEPEEVEACKKDGVGYEEVHVATDALTVMINNENPVSCLTVEQLGDVWGADSKLSNWSEIPGVEEEFDEELALFGPGTDSGTFDYFTESINGEEGVSRKDYNNVGEDDNATVKGVEGSPGGMGYAGFSFYTENEGSLKALEVDNGKGCVPPSVETAQDGSYAPLSRPLFMYPSEQALAKPEVKAFITYYLENVNSVAEGLGFVPLTDEQLEESTAAAEKAGA
ncbi:MAG TPA: PstS family phosphate ABC transporter substrate-binding protein [Solirubrobacterales bacterium]|nr:PstS family phosphate ABC transporter substrate-binding protein [Solirubrobacterales bacterium]